MAEAFLVKLASDDYKTVSFQKEAMRTQVALYFFIKWHLYKVVSLCLHQQNVQNRQVEKSLLLWNIVIRKKWLDLIAFVYNKTRSSWHIIRPTRI